MSDKKYKWFIVNEDNEIVDEFDNEPALHKALDSLMEDGDITGDTRVYRVLEAYRVKATVNLIRSD